MTDEQVLIQEIHTLPENLKQEVLHFVQFLKQKQTADSKTFDELLAEFAEYRK